MKSLKPGAKIYFIAIAGTGMSALAGLLKQRGYEVSGSDIACYPPVSDLLASLNIEVKLAYDVQHLKNFDPDYVVIGNFVRRDNEQAQYVIAEGIEYGSLPSTLEDYFLQETDNYVVVGTHGKSTTASCLSYLLSAAGRQPSFFLGAVPFNFGKSFDFSQGKEFVLEGDEYDTAFFDKESKFLHYKPKVGIWTSMEFDHADIFDSIEQIESMFRKFVHLIPEEGSLIYCRDWERIHSVVQEMRSELNVKNIESYGFHSQADHVIQDFSAAAGGMSFKFDGYEFRNFMTGEFNALNFTAAVLAGQKAGVEVSALQRGLSEFSGLKRRQEVRAELKGHAVIDDFAHHPTAVKQVIEGLRARFPSQRLVVFFEPRSNTTRRSIFQREFEAAFEQADLVLLPEVFRKEALGDGQSLDVEKVVRSLNSKSIEAYGPLSQQEMIAQAVGAAKEGPCCFAILSNGAFDGLHLKLISELEKL